MMVQVAKFLPSVWETYLGRAPGFLLQPGLVSDTLGASEVNQWMGSLVSHPLHPIPSVSQIILINF